MCGGKASANPDLSIETANSMIKLLAQEDKSYRSAIFSANKFDAEPQLIAEVIVAFQMNRDLA